MNIQISGRRTRRRSLFPQLFCTLALTSALFASGKPAANAAEVPHHLQLARQLVSEIQAVQALGILTDDNNVEMNRYGGSWGETYIQFGDLDNNIYPANYSRCSSFVTLLLREAYDWNWRDYEFYDPIKQEIRKTSSPASYRYQALINQGVGFSQQITRLDEVLPGDVMTMVDVGDDDGHTALVDEVRLDSALPYPENLADSDPALFGTWYFEVQVLDCSSSDHTDDTREFVFQGNEIDTDGVGIGTLGVLTDANYQVVGYTWSLPNSDYHSSPNGWLSGLHSRLKLQTVRAVTFGRLNTSAPEAEPNPEPTPDPEPAPEPVPTPDSVTVIGHEATAPAPFGPAHLALGLQLVGQIVQQQSEGIFLDSNGVSLNRYGGSWSSSSDQVFIQWADENYVAASYSKCSSFVTLLLQAAYNWNWKDYEFHDPILDEVVSKSSPHSYRYAALIKQQVGFTSQITRLDQAAAGDVMAMHDIGDTSGHTVIFVDMDLNAGKPYPENEVDSDPAWAGTTLYEVRILDVNKSAHSDDTRRITIDGIEEKTGGAGVGVMGILVDANFHVVGHTWSLPGYDYHTRPDKWVDSLNGRIKPQTSRELVIGRLP